MRWSVTLVAELEPGQVTEHPLAQIERGDAITPASLGLSIAEGKAIVAAIQTAMVTAQIQRHGESARRCPHCARSRRTKGYYTAIFRSVFGKVPMRVRRLRACPCHDTGRDSASVLATKRNPIAPELRYLTAKLAALMPFGKVASFLDEVLPTSTRTHASTVRNRMRRVGQRLERHQDELATAVPHEPAAAIVVGLDGGYVKNQQPRPERTFEVIAGKVLGEDEQTTRFAFVRKGSASGGAVIAQLLRQHGMGPNTRVTVLSDGEAGLRAIQRAAAPHAEHVLDWFHLAMRFRHLTQLAKGIPDRETREGAMDTMDRAKWRVWNGQSPRALADLRIWRPGRRHGEVPAVVIAFCRRLTELIAYLDANADSLPNYGDRRRQGLPFSTAFVESAVNEIVSRRMVKRQQMRWNRFTIQPFLTVRVHVLNDTLEAAFRQWHQAFRPLVTSETTPSSEVAA